jgi:Ca2+-binding RTX toxin-like protein
VATLTIGPGQQFTTISAAIEASRDGDVLQVQAGTYTNDFATINTKITLQGVGGMVRIDSPGDVPNGKGILIVNTDVTIDHFEFSGSAVSSGNGAGIRYQGGNLTVTNSYFHTNQNGILANPDPNGTITIRNSEFASNGAGDGYSHNIYVGDIARLTITDSYFHDAIVGHQIKSRAVETIITNNRIYDEDGSSSYSIDLPNGGRATVTGNIIQQGENGENPYIVAFGEEGDLHAVNSLIMTGNTVINDMDGATLLWNASGSPAILTGTRVWNLTDAQLVEGAGVRVASTVHLGAEPALDGSHPWAPDVPPPPPPPTLPTLGDDVLTVSAATSNIHALAGNDTINGGAYAGPTSLNGDAGNDLVIGGAGKDYLSGDAGNDTLTGGGGADTFHFMIGAGVDRVTDFNQAQGDRVVLDPSSPATPYMALQIGANTVICVAERPQMILVNVQLSSLSSGWIYEA